MLLLALGGALFLLGVGFGLALLEAPAEPGEQTVERTIHVQPDPATVTVTVTVDTP